MSEKFAKVSEKKEGGDGESSGYKEKAQMPGFCGNLYQSKWLMWYLLKGISSKQYKFELGTEIEAAGKYDDLVFKYRKGVDGNERDYFIIMQSKHRTGNNKKITYKDVLTDENVDMGLVKYFNSFVESKNAKMFTDGVIEHAIIYTNARFNMNETIPEIDQNWKKLKNIKNITEEMNLKPDDILSAFKIKGGKFYQFKSDLVLPVLKSMVLDYEYYRIARKLVECLKGENKYLSLNDKILKRYNHLLLKDVIDKKNRMFFEDFLNLNCDDDENVTGRKKLRKALDKVLNDEGLKIEEIATKAFKWRKDFEKSGEIMQTWAADIDDGDLKEFLKKSVFATEQPDEIKLGRTIMDDLRKQFSTYETDLMYSHFYAEIQDWMKGGHLNIDKSQNIFKNRFISFENASDFFENTKRKLDKMMLKGPIADYDRHIQEYNINFIDLKFDSAIKAFLDSDQRILNIVSKHIMISSIKLYTKLTITIKLDEFIFIKLSTSNNHSLNSAIKAFESEPTDRLLVLEWDHDETKLDEWAYKISDIIDAIQSNDQKKLIIISSRDDILENYFQNDFFIDTECVEIEDIANTLANLENNSQDSFLNTIAEFQGKDAKLIDFISTNDLKNTVNGNILQKILKREIVNIGKQIEDLKTDTQNCYIDRKFKCKIENDKNVYLLIGLNELDLCFDDQNYKIIKKYELTTQIEIDTFKHLVDENKSKNVYLLKKENNCIILLKKSKELFDESDFRNTIKCEHNKQEINLMSAVAGSGKSTLFVKLSQKIKDQNPELWVVKIDLNAVSSKLNEIQRSNRVEIQFETIIDLLNHGANHENELEKTIFKHQLQRKNIMLLLDGFDEVCPSYKSIVLKLIQILKNEAAIKAIWISTRPYDSILNDIEKYFVNFSVKYYYFEPLTEDNQKEYLKNFWQQSIVVDERFFKLFVEELFKLFNNNMKGDFLGLPLHIMLIGVTIKDTFENFQNTSTSEINAEQRQKLLEMVDLSTFYDKFVRFKCQIHSEDKSFLNLHTEAGKGIFSESCKSYFIKSKSLALDSLLDEHELQILLTETESKNLKKYREEIKRRGDPIGIVNRIVDGKPQFIHRTFAEYLVAMFFIENMKRKGKGPQKIIEYFLKNKITDENSVVYDFIDSKLNDEPNFIEYNHKYGNVVKTIDGGKLYFVLKKKWQNIAEILIKNGINLNYEYNGKTILYKASKLERSKGKESILSMIFKKMNYKKDRLIKELLMTNGSQNDTPLLVAARFGIFENIKIIFEICKKMEILDDVISRQDKSSENIMHLTAKNDCNNNSFTRLLNLLKSEPAKLNDLLRKKNIDNHTPFDTAVINGQRNKFEIMWNLCGELDISTDSVLFNETKDGSNIIHLAAYSNFNDNCFSHLLNLLKNEPKKLNALLTKKDILGYTPLDTAVMYGQRNKFEAMWNLFGELDISTDCLLFNETKEGENIIHLAAYSICNDDCLTYLLNLLKSAPNKLIALLTKKNCEGHTPLNIAVTYGQRNKFESMWNFCRELNISTGSVLFNEFKDNENIIQLVASCYCNDDFFTYMMTLSKTEPAKLKAILIKNNCFGYTLFDSAVINCDRRKFEAMWNLCGELDISMDSVLSNETERSENIIHLAMKRECDDDFFTYLLNLFKNTTGILKDLLIKKNIEGCTPFDTALKYGQQNKFEGMWNLCEELNISTDSVLFDGTEDGGNIIHLVATDYCNYDCFIYLLNLLKNEQGKLKTLLIKKNSGGYTPFDAAVKNGQRKKFEAMWNLCEELDISTDSVLYNETEEGENIIHLAAYSIFTYDCFNYLLNLLKSDLVKLKALLTKTNGEGHTPLNIARIHGQDIKLKVLLKIWDELDEVQK